MSAPRTEVKIEDVMRKEVIAARDTDTIVAVSRLMSKDNIGSVVIVSKSGKPVGIVTERDIVKRVTAKNLAPAKVKASSVMSKPLMTIDPDVDIAEAMKRMKRMGVRRLIVMKKGDMVGMVSAKDIVDITPTLIDVVAEKSRIGVAPRREGEPLAGRCDTCGAWSDDLKPVDGRFVCEDCRADIEDERKIS